MVIRYVLWVATWMLGNLQLMIEILHDLIYTHIYIYAHINTCIYIYIYIIHICYIYMYHTTRIPVPFVYKV